MTTIINPFDGQFGQYPVTLTWQGHKAQGLAGGTDYAVPPGTEIRACVSGTAKYIGQMADGYYMVQITYAIGRAIVYRELGTVRSHGSWKVKIGDVIGSAALHKWPHIDATILGVRRQFEPLVTPKASIASVGTVTAAPAPTTSEEIPEMHIFKSGTSYYASTPTKVFKISQPQAAVVAKLNSWKPGALTVSLSAAELTLLQQVVALNNA